jgi:hypothetical protein
MAMAYAMGLPGALEDAALASGMSILKDTEGRGLMLRMARPRSKAGEPLVWWDEPEKLARLYAYCQQDVRVERELHKRVMPLSDTRAPRLVAGLQDQPARRADRRESGQGGHHARRRHEGALQCRDRESDWRRSYCLHRSWAYQTLAGNTRRARGGRRPCEAGRTDLLARERHPASVPSMS